MTQSFLSLFFRSLTAARKILPEVFGMVAAGTEEGTESDDTLSMACQTAHLLTMKEPSISKPLLTYNVIVSLSKLSQNKYDDNHTANWQKKRQL